MINSFISCNLIFDSNKLRRKDDVMRQKCCYHAIILDFFVWPFSTYWMILTKRRYTGDSWWMRHMTNNPMPDSNQEHGIFMVHISYIPSSLDWEATMLTDTTLFLRFSLLSSRIFLWLWGWIIELGPSGIVDKHTISRSSWISIPNLSQSSSCPLYLAPPRYPLEQCDRLSGPLSHCGVWPLLFLNKRWNDSS